MGSAATTLNTFTMNRSAMTPGKLHASYHMEYQIGKGGFSQVFLSTHKKDQTKVAMKRINILSALTHTRGLEALSNELQVYQRIGSHDNIVQLHCAYRLKNHFFFVMDCLLGGDLRQFLKANGRLSQQSICYIVASLGSGLHHMHQRGVFHRDIKPENIAFDCQGKPYLTDFGISHLSTVSNTTKQASLISRESSGTLPYLAPEVLTRTHEHSYQSDFWSLGIVAYELVYERRPFEPHVPLHYIYFAANHYYKIWDELRTGECVEKKLPFPHYHVTFNEDGSVPPSLLVPMFATRQCSGKVNEPLIDLMKGLLDIRIPERLGSVNQFMDFSHHAAFLQHGYHPVNLRVSKSPVLAEDWSGILTGEIKSRLFVQSSEVVAPQEQLTPAVEMELEKLFYIRSAHAHAMDLDFEPIQGFSKKFADITFTQNSSLTTPSHDSLQ